MNNTSSEVDFTKVFAALMNGHYLSEQQGLKPLSVQQITIAKAEAASGAKWKDILHSFFESNPEYMPYHPVKMKSANQYISPAQFLRSYELRPMDFEGTERAFFETAIYFLEDCKAAQEYSKKWTIWLVRISVRELNTKEIEHALARCEKDILFHRQTQRRNSIFTLLGIIAK